MKGWSILRCSPPRRRKSCSIHKRRTCLLHPQLPSRIHADFHFQELDRNPASGLSPNRNRNPPKTGGFLFSSLQSPKRVLKENTPRHAGVAPSLEGPFLNAPMCRCEMKPYPQTKALVRKDPFSISICSRIVFPAARQGPEPLATIPWTPLQNLVPNGCLQRKQAALDQSHRRISSRVSE